MKEWDDFLYNYLKNDEFESFSYTEGKYTNLNLEPIILKTLQIMNRLESKGHDKNVFLFPKLKPLVNQLVMSIAIYDIVNGNIPVNYNMDYEVGQKLMVGDAVVLYEGQSKGLIKIATKDGTHYLIPPDVMPVFQKADQSRALSSSNRFSRNREKYIDVHSSVLNMLLKNKSYLEKSIIYVSDINKQELKNRFANILINGIPLKDLLLITYVDREGNFEGRFDAKGNPAVIVVNDFCSVKQIIKKKIPVYRVICNFKNDAESQAADLGQVMSKLKVPFTVFGNLFQAFSLDLWKAKSFNIFKWDNKTITPDMYSHSGIPALLENCHDRQIEYVSFHDDMLLQIFNSLNFLRDSYKSCEQEKPDYYWELYNNFMMVVRNVIPGNTFAHVIDSLPVIESAIEEDLLNISHDMEKAYRNIISLLQSYACNESSAGIYDKAQWLVDVLSKNNYEKIAVIVPDKSNLAELHDVWSQCYLVYAKNIHTKVDFYTPSMLASIPRDYDNYYVISWFIRKQMQHLLYNFEISRYCILLYDFEKQHYCDRTMRSWNHYYDSSSTLNAIKKFYQNNDIDKIFTEVVEPIDKNEEGDDFEEFEARLFQSRFKNFVSSSYSGDVVVSAVPVSFTDGRMCAFSESHSIVKVNNLISGKNGDVKIIKPKGLNIGDFIAIGKSNREFIKELADRGLERAGLSDLREKTHLWRDYMNAYLNNHSKKEFVAALFDNGLTSDKQTIDVWIRDTELIAPRTESLITILRVCKPSLSDNEINEIDTACRTIQNAHRDAGKEFTKALKKRLVELIADNSHLFKEHDGCVTDIDVEDMGTLDILKVAAIFPKVELERNKTNRVQEL